MKNRVGQVFTTNEGYEVEVISYISATNITAKFKDKHGYVFNTRWTTLKNGGIKNPFHPSVYGIGYLGITQDGIKPKTRANGSQTREYNVWKSMLQRSYDTLYRTKFPTYEGVIVCNRWLCFANFLEDLPLIEGYEYWLNHPNERVALDKDIKGNGSKTYSLNNCCFVSASMNSEEVNKRVNRTKQGGHNKRKVMCIETGEVFDSVRIGAKSINVSDTSLVQHLRGGSKICGGLHWKYVEIKDKEEE